MVTNLQIHMKHIIQCVKNIILSFEYLLTNSGALPTFYMRMDSRFTDGSAKPLSPIDLCLPSEHPITAHDQAQDIAPLKLEEREDWDRKARTFS